VQDIPLHPEFEKRQVTGDILRHVRGLTLDDNAVKGVEICI